MTKEVLINITGIHTDMIERGEEDEPVAVITPANYFQKNGKHYILYDEVAEGMPGVTKNKIKISGDNTIETCYGYSYERFADFRNRRRN